MNEKIKAIWEKICAGASVAGEFATKTAGTVSEKAKDVFNDSKANLKIFDLTTDIDVLYKEIGKLIYAAHTNGDPDAEELDARLAVIDEKMAQIETLRASLEKAKKTCPDCDKENAPESAFCAACGAKLDD